MRTFALTHNMPAAISIPRAGAARKDEGVLIFSGISIALAALGIIFNALNLPSAFLF
jgi:hypothetical protein